MRTGSEPLDGTQRTERVVWAVCAMLLLVGLVLLVPRWFGGDESSAADVDSSASAPVSQAPTIEDRTPEPTPPTEPPMATEPAPTTELPAEATVVPTASPAGPTVEEQVAELRDSDMWLGLAEWDRATPRGRHSFYWASTEQRECGYGEFSNQAEVWNDFAPQLRDELLRMVVEEGIEPETVRFRGSPIQDGFVSGVLPWWSNGPTGSQGRGTMFSAQASYVTA